MILRENLNELEKRGQVNAIIPNIIHSLDASHLMNVVISAKDKKINYVLPIHDCFGTHPNKLNELERLVKQEFIKIYSNEKFIAKFHAKIIKNIKENNLKPTPPAAVVRGPTHINEEAASRLRLPEPRQPPYPVCACSHSENPGLPPAHPLSRRAK